MSREQSDDQSSVFGGYLEKKSKNLISTWQRRYFQILDGKVMVYSLKKEDNEIKGQLNLDLISMPESVDSRIFKFVFDQRVFSLRADNEEEKNKWIKAITDYKNELIKYREALPLRDSMRLKPGKLMMAQDTSTLKKNKIESAGKVTYEIIKKHGLITNKEEKLSNELLKAKGISELINITDPKIISRIYHGFLFKKHKAHDYYQKRWFFVFSCRPVFDSNYAKDDFDLDQKKQKEWLKFDTLYYFKYEDKDESSQSSGSLELLNSHKIELVDKEDKFYLFLDVQDRKFDFYCETKAERDIWYEVLKNSRRTAKEYNASITKHPRNIEPLYNIFLDGEKDFYKQLEKDKKNIVGKYSENEDFEVFEFTINNLVDSIISTLDGCNSNIPPKDDLAQAYATYMSKEYLEIIKSFWDKKYSEINIYDTLKISMSIINFDERLNKLVKVEDPNLLKNAKALIKIYLKKTYKNVLSVIENILKDEREIKALKNESGIYYTKGPYDLFELLSGTFDLVKNNNNKYIYQLILNLCYSSINQYLLGVETVLNNREITIDKEYLLAMANNSLYIIDLLNKFLDNVKDMNVLTEKELNEYFRMEKLMEAINKISLKSITAFVFCFVNELGQFFKDIPFNQFDMTKILVTTKEIFGPYKQFMNTLVLKKSWNEILKLTLYHYIRLLLTSKLSSITVEVIRQKLKEDAGILIETYEGLVGKNLTESTVKILYDIHDFLAVNSNNISSPCLTLRQYVGPSFDLTVVRTLIKLRTDFKPQEINDALIQCKDVLDKCKNDTKENANSNYFQIIEKELKQQAEEEQRLKMNQTTSNNGEAQKEGKSEGKRDLEDDAKAEETTIFALDNFINDEEEEKEGKDEKQVKTFYEEDIGVGQEEVSDIVFEGNMLKKTHSKWQARYFQLKSGYLYWFKEKISCIVQNKISIKNTTSVDAYKTKKFKMTVNLTNLNSSDVNGSSTSLSNASINEDNEEIKEAGCKVYKFACENDKERDAWVEVIRKEMEKYKAAETNSHKLVIPLRTIVIKDYYNLPGFNEDIYYMRKIVSEEMKTEKYFKPSEKILEVMEKKRIQEEKEKIQKEKEKEKEEEEKKKQEENKKIEEDIKSGKDVGFSNRIKFWFRTNVEEKIKTNINEFLESK